MQPIPNKYKTAIEQDAYDVANALIRLQKYPLDEIRFEKEYQLTE